MLRFDERFLEAFGQYTTYIMEMMEIKDWRVKLVDDPPDGEDAAASVKCIKGRRNATLRLCMDFFDYPSEDQRHYLIHELCHIFNDGLDKISETVMAGLSMSAYSQFEAAWIIALENHTDQLAYVIGELVEGYSRHDRLWANVIRAERGELPLPDPDTVVSAPMPGLDPKES